ncbi:cupin domain-containing protein [Azospirillum sp. SYSU D00513]|uniref:cupin domain-containing protein n=1 Tax=Azospirillum sp. SYSU D00513 TaxID=2812561 RepID=UPI001A969473|nr:cupin domain-containing protein [Azospirillum sp. SYSU D00513]
MRTQDEDNVVRMGALELRFLVDEEQSAGSTVTFEFVVPTNARVPAPHYHEAVDEVVYGLSGTLTTTIDGRKQAVRPGDCVFIPRGSVHHHENPHPETARALVVLTPGTIGKRYFVELAELVNGPGKPDPDRVKEIMHRYGLVTV